MLHRTQSMQKRFSAGRNQLRHLKFSEIFAIQGNFTLKEKEQVIYKHIPS